MQAGAGYDTGKACVRLWLSHKGLFRLVGFMKLPVPLGHQETRRTAKISNLHSCLCSKGPINDCHMVGRETEGEPAKKTAVAPCQFSLPAKAADLHTPDCALLRRPDRSVCQCFQSAERGRGAPCKVAPVLQSPSS